MTQTLTERADEILTKWNTVEALETNFAPRMAALIAEMQKRIEELEAHLEWEGRIVGMHLENYARLQEGINLLKELDNAG